MDIKHIRIIGRLLNKEAMNKEEIKEFLKHITQMASNNLSIEEIAVALDFDVHEFKELIHSNDAILHAYEKGKVAANIEFKQSLREQTLQGRTKAVEIYNELIQEQNKSIGLSSKYIETREQKYIRLRAIRLMHYFSNISDEVLAYIKEKNGYDEEMERINWAYEANRL
jgi:hypothetical protein